MSPANAQKHRQKRSNAAQASGILATAIVGGAILPTVFGLVADITSLTAALLVPVTCYVIIASYGLYAERQRQKAG